MESGPREWPSPKRRCRLCGAALQESSRSRCGGRQPRRMEAVDSVEESPSWQQNTPLEVSKLTFSGSSVITTGPPTVRRRSELEYSSGGQPPEPPVGPQTPGGLVAIQTNNDTEGRMIRCCCAKRTTWSHRRAFNSYRTTRRRSDEPGIARRSGRASGQATRKVLVGTGGRMIIVRLSPVSCPGRQRVPG